MIRNVDPKALAALFGPPAIVEASMKAFHRLETAGGWSAEGGQELAAQRGQVRVERHVAEREIA